MSAVDAIKPYASLAKWVLIALLAVALVVGGCSHGKATQRDADRKQLDKAATALHAASAKLASAASALWDIDARTKANKAAADAQFAHADALAERARTDHAKDKKAVASLEQQLLDERTGCVDARRPICGIPLR